MGFKFVYYGPALSGKTTNLMQLHEQLDVKGRSDLMVLDTKDDRTIFFDLLPFFFVTPTGLKIKVKVYTVPVHIRHDATRKAVLARADGVAFIADSKLTEATNNYGSFENLEQNLGFVGLDIEKIPLVIQFNKRDLQDIVAEDEIKKIWEPTGLKIFLASARFGSGVLETFRGLVDRTYNHLDKRFGLMEKHKLPKEDFINNLTCNLSEN